MDTEVEFTEEITATEKTTLEDIGSVIKMDTLVNNNDSKIVLLFFYTDDCAVCSEMYPKLRNLIEYQVSPSFQITKNLSILRLNVDEIDPDDYGVEKIPTVIVTKDDKALKAFVGSDVKVIEDFLYSLV